MIEIWQKEDILKLSTADKNQWFDVLNQGLLEDRGYSANNPNINKIMKEIKKDYIDYLMNCSIDDSFLGYYILRNEKQKIVSLCRVIKKDTMHYLEGLETHRDFYQKGYASKLLRAVIKKLKANGVLQLYSVVRKHNKSSIQFHQKHGFVIQKRNDKNIFFVLDIENAVRRELFDKWAKEYNQSVIISEQEGTYPFAGYSEVKYQIINEITKYKKANILEMGIGTGEITKPLYEMDYQITGVDLSEEMIKIAKNNMKKARFINRNFEDALKELSDDYDVIIFSYSIHHLSYKAQTELLINLHKHLNQGGIIIIGDVSTQTTTEMEKLAHAYHSIWDDEEYYPVFDLYNTSKLLNLYDIDFKDINQVAGLLHLKVIKKS